MKNIFKKIFVVLCLVFVGFSLCGCAQVDYNVILRKSENQLYVDVVVNIDLTDLTESYRDEVYRGLRIYYRQLDKKYEETLVDYFSNVYDFDSMAITDGEGNESPYSEKDKFDYIIRERPNFNIGKPRKDSAEDVEIVTAPYKKLRIEKRFLSVYAFIMYFNPTKAFVYDEEKNDVVISDSYKSLVDIPVAGQFSEEDGLIVNRYVQTCSPFYYDMEEPKFLESSNVYHTIEGETLIEYFERNTHMSREDVELIFNFSTPYRRLHSDGTMTKTANGYTHTWTLGSIDSTVKMWRNYANYPFWYVFAGVVGITVLVVGLVVIGITNSKKKKIGMEALQKIHDIAQNNDTKK